MKLFVSLENFKTSIQNFNYYKFNNLIILANNAENKDDDYDFEMINILEIRNGKF